MKIAIAGGIGSGKSAVTAILRSLGAKVVVADEINKELLTDPSYISLLANYFPDCVHNNVINKKELAACVYRDEGKRKELMAISHPKIMQRMLSLYPDCDLVFYEIPLLSEVDYPFDLVWYLACDESTRVARIVNRDQIDPKLAKHIIHLQKGEENVAARADLVIRNQGDLNALRELVTQEYCSILRKFS